MIRITLEYIVEFVEERNNFCRPLTYSDITPVHQTSGVKCVFSLARTPYCQLLLYFWTSLGLSKNSVVE